MESSHNSTMEPLDLTVYLSRFLKSLKRFWILVIALSLLMAGQNYIRARRSFTPIYECTALISVGSGYSSGDIFSSSSYYDNAAAQSMASSFSHVVSSEFMRDLMAAELGGSISGSISASVITSTSLLELRVTGSNPEKIYDTLNAVITCYPQAAVYMVDNPILTVREAPVVPTEPINAFSASATVRSGAIQGLVIGLAIVVFFALLNQTVGSPKELKKLINLPMLATLPQVSTKKRRKNTHVLITSDDDAGLAEALRGLRTKVRKQLEEREGKVILLTSTIPGEGKTTVSTNLALSLAAEGHRVVLVDADLRSQTIARLFRSKSEVGLMDCLKNPKLSVLSCLKEVPDSNLYYLSGASTQKRHYSIEAKSIRRVMDTLTQHFDYVVVDTPPCSVVSDTSMLARYADCVLYVVKLNHANQSQILDGITGLHQKDVPLTGCVINGAPRSKTSYDYGYGYGYGSKYGYGQTKKSSKS